MASTRFTFPSDAKARAFGQSAIASKTKWGLTSVVWKGRTVEVHFAKKTPKYTRPVWSAAVRGGASRATHPEP